MRLLDRNKRPFYYALYEGESMLTNSEGKFTGERGKTYSEPVKSCANITSANRSTFAAASNGVAVPTEYGVSINYDKILQIEDMNCPIDETSVLWIDELDTSKPYDYVVRRVSVSLNHIAITARKVR